MGQTIACANQKGGVGKTTTVVNLGDLSGPRRTSASSSSTSIRRATRRAASGSTGRPSIDRSTTRSSTGARSRPSIVATGVAGLSVVPSSIALAGAEVELAAVDQRERRLRRVLDAVAERLRLHPARLPAVARAAHRQRADRRRRRAHPDPVRVLRTRGTHPTDRHRQPRPRPPESPAGDQGRRPDDVRRPHEPVRGRRRRGRAGTSGSAVFETVIPRSVRLSEAPSFGLPIALYRPDSRGAEAYARPRRRAPARDRRGGRASGPARGQPRARPSRRRDRRQCAS